MVNIFLDPVHLARFQFAFTMSLHIIFPSLTIGLASYLAVLEALWLWTGRDIYRSLFKYWVRIFAVAFGMGVVSGIVMSYQIGTNWSGFAERAGPTIGPPMAFEVLSAFFVEAGFLGIMLFGIDRVGRGLHAVATFLVAIGTLMSSFWILVVNSWMQTPTGFVEENGRFIPTDWWAVIFNPSMPFRIVHMVLAAYLTTALLVGAVAAWHMLRGRAGAESRKMFSMATAMLVIVAPTQILVGDMHGLNTLAHQPDKVMAIEGHFESYPDGAPLYLFGWPDQKAGRMRAGLAIPKLGSLVLKHDLNAPMEGLDTVPRDQWPFVLPTFWSFRIMVAIGLAILGLSLWALWARWRGRLYSSRWLHRAALAMGPAGFIAVLAGWGVTETGRQPWLVYGLLTTVDGAAPVDGFAVGASLLSFIVVYAVVYVAGIFYLLRMMNRPPVVDRQPEAA